jgi:hypothetical protein
MDDKQLLIELLNSDFEFEAIAKLSKRGLFEDANAKRWVSLGNMPNNQSVVHAQQSTPAAALVEKFTNGLDAILLRRCKALSLDPRGLVAPQTMTAAIQKWFGKHLPKFDSLRKKISYFTQPAPNLARVFLSMTQAKGNCLRIFLVRFAR